jgi:hypothetical protein
VGGCRERRREGERERGPGGLTERDQVGGAVR